MNRSITTVVLALVIGAGATLTACGSDEVGKPNDGTGSPTSKEATPDQTAQEPSPEPTEDESDSVFDEGRKDVTIKSCAIGDPLGIGENTAVADLTITNSSGKVSDYLIEIEVTDPDTGTRKETLATSVSRVAPRQTVDTGNGDGEEDASGTDSQVTGPIKCTVLSADRTASVE